MLETILRISRKVIPHKVFEVLQPTYHYLLALLGAIIYRFPSKEIFVVGITGTKGKTSTAELVNAILEEAGYKTALAGTLRFKIGETSKPNKYKMTMPGRFVIQKFLRNAVSAGCQYVVLEMTSQAVLQSRHKWIYLDALIFTNLAPEHIESHGSYENYIEAKLTLARILETSPKKRTMLVVNADDAEGHRFLQVRARERYPYSLTDAKPYHVEASGITFTWKNMPMHSPLQGTFNLYNILGAATFAHTIGIPEETIKRALGRLDSIKGRVERVEIGQDFTVIVDYAHTPDSLNKLYEAFPDARKICVLGNTGGGRDTWKRPAMGKIANDHCNLVILTDEDPYDEDPRTIVDQMAAVIDPSKLTILMDRREAIAAALSKAEKNDVVLITGKGTDPFIMKADGAKIPWSDAEVAKEELEKIWQKKNREAD
jgi:UDP-N-acetylmuramoyl-L-alanyl-D-glutamate--2,6-diaminopimelate ligase